MSRATKQVLVINRGTTPPMRAGKACAQAGHGAAAWLIARMIYAPGILTDAEKTWLADGGAKIVVYVRSEADLLAVLDRAENTGLEAHLINDAGHTEFDGVPTPTCVTIGPDWSERIDPVTADLPLY